MGSATRAITDRVTKQIVTIFSKTCKWGYPYSSVLLGCNVLNNAKPFSGMVC